MGQQKPKETRKDEKSKETGMAALYSYLCREYVVNGIDFLTSPFMQHLSLSEKKLQFIENCELLPL